MLLTRTKNLIERLLSRIQNLQSNTIKDEELADLYYGMLEDQRYFQASKTEKADRWSKPTDDQHTKTDTILDFVIEIAPAMTQQALRAINTRLIPIEQKYAKDNQAGIMRKASLAKYLLAYEIFRIETSNAPDEQIKNQIDDIYNQLNPTPEADTDKNALIQTINVSKIFLLIHFIEDKKNQLENTPKNAKEIKQIKLHVRKAIEKNTIQEKHTLFFNMLVELNLELDVYIADEKLRQYRKSKKTLDKKSKLEERSASAIDIGREVYAPPSTVRPQSASACIDRNKSLGFFALLSPKLSGKVYSKTNSREGLCGSSASEISSLSASLNALDQSPSGKPRSADRLRGSSPSDISPMSASLNALALGIGSPELEDLASLKVDNFGPPDAGCFDSPDIEFPESTNAEYIGSPENFSEVVSPEDPVSDNTTSQAFLSLSNRGFA